MSEREAKEALPLIAKQIAKETNEGKAIGLGLLAVATAIVHFSNMLEERIKEGITVY